MNLNVNTFTTKGQAIPYYYFVYEGDFYKYLHIRNNKYFGNGTRINEFFLNETFRQYDFSDTFTAFTKATMIIIHCFPDYTERDLDNNSYKPVIDAVRKIGIIENDAWYNLSLMLFGDEAESEKIEAFIVPHEYTGNFITSDEIQSIRNLFHPTSISSITTNKEILETKQYF